MAGLVSVLGLIKDNGPQLMLTQLLPSSTVAPAVRLKTGMGTLLSLVPGGTRYQPEAPASRGIFEPLQYSLTTPGLKLAVLGRKPAPPPA